MQLAIGKHTSENALKKKTPSKAALLPTLIKSRPSHFRKADHKKYKFHIPVKQARVAFRYSLRSGTRWP